MADNPPVQHRTTSPRGIHQALVKMNTELGNPRGVLIGDGAFKVNQVHPRKRGQSINGRKGTKKWDTEVDKTWLSSFRERQKLEMVLMVPYSYYGGRKVKDFVVAAHLKVNWAAQKGVLNVYYSRPKDNAKQFINIKKTLETHLGIKIKSECFLTKSGLPKWIGFNALIAVKKILEGDEIQVINPEQIFQTKEVIWSDALVLDFLNENSDLFGPGAPV